MADDETTAPEPPEEIDLTQIRVEGLMLQVASELMSIGAGQLGMIPQMVNGGDAFQASLAIGGADALVETFLAALPEGTPVPPPVEELRGALRLPQREFSAILGALAPTVEGRGDGYAEAGWAPTPTPAQQAEIARVDAALRTGGLPQGTFIGIGGRRFGYGRPLSRSVMTLADCTVPKAENC